MNILISGDKTFALYQYSKEREFEEQIIRHSQNIFGSNSYYIDVKKKIRKDNVETIPDAYLIDFSFESEPRLYIVENELVGHDPYKHIGQQLLKFAIAYKASGRKIKKFLLHTIQKNKSKLAKVSKGLKKAGYRNIDAFLEDLIFEKPVAVIVIIDEITHDLQNVLTQLTMKSDVLEFQTYIFGDEKIHRFTPFQQEIRAVVGAQRPKFKVEDLDTIVVPANKEGFKEVFLGLNCWYAVSISTSMIDRIKYIAGYQTWPISAITHHAEVAKIEKYKDTNKYILFFKDQAEKIGPITLPKNSPQLIPQRSRYTNFEKLRKSKTLSDIF